MAISYLVISCSLNPDSRSRVLARDAHELLAAGGETVELVDLIDWKLPICDGGTCYADEHVQRLTRKLTEAKGILLCTPVYNYDSNAAAKNVIELTGNAWTGKVVGFACVAGGRSSYMSIMSLANNLMLDFRCWIVPRFVYATGEHFRNEHLSDPTVRQRLEELVGSLKRLTSKLFESDGKPA